MAFKVRGCVGNSTINEDGLHMDERAYRATAHHEPAPLPNSLECLQ